MAAAALGSSLGFVTVLLAGTLDRWVSRRRVPWVAGLGTGAAYLFSNLPWFFSGTPSIRALAPAALCGVAALLVPGRCPPKQRTARTRCRSRAAGRSVSSAGSALSPPWSPSIRPPSPTSRRCPTSRRKLGRTAAGSETGRSASPGSIAGWPVLRSAARAGRALGHRGRFRPGLAAAGGGAGGCDRASGRCSMHSASAPTARRWWPRRRRAAEAGGCDEPPGSTRSPAGWRRAWEWRSPRARERVRWPGPARRALPSTWLRRSDSTGWSAAGWSRSAPLRSALGAWSHSVGVGCRGGHDRLRPGGARSPGLRGRGLSALSLAVRPARDARRGVVGPGGAARPLSAAAHARQSPDRPRSRDGRAAACLSLAGGSFARPGNLVSRLSHAFLCSFVRRLARSGSGGLPLESRRRSIRRTPSAASGQRSLGVGGRARCRRRARRSSLGTVRHAMDGPVDEETAAPWACRYRR